MVSMNAAGWRPIEGHKMEELAIPERAAKIDGALDHLLAAFLGEQHDERAEGEQGSLALTVYVRGTAFTGIAISRREWLERFAERTSTASSRGADLVRSALAESWDERDDRDTELAEAGEPVEPRYFIHMKDAMAFSGPAGHRHQLLRIDAASIDAWAIGTMKPAD